MPRRKATTRTRYTLQQAKSIADAPPLCHDRQDCPLTVSLGNTDLPAFVSDGKLYIQAPLPHVFKAFAEDFSAFIRDMEIGISTARGTALSFDRYGRPIPRAGVVEPSLVPSGGLE